MKTDIYLDLVLIETGKSFRKYFNTEFERDNFLTRFMAGYYAFDTNTNVCPSIHVTGSLAVMFTSFHCKDFGKGMKVTFAVTGVLIAISTVFVKQHSILDLLAALPFCAVAYALCFGIGWGFKKQEFFAA